MVGFENCDDDDGSGGVGVGKPKQSTNSISWPRDALLSLPSKYVLALKVPFVPAHTCNITFFVSRIRFCTVWGRSMITGIFASQLL